jgi:nitroreductase
MAPDACSQVRKELLPGPEQVDHFLRCRRSIRTFKDKPLERNTIQGLIDTARYAPTAHNFQPVRWLVIEHKDGIRRFASLVIDWMHFMIKNVPEIAGPMHFERVVDAWDAGEDRVLRGAPHLIVAYGDSALTATQTSCIIALTYLELAAYSRGLGACWAGYFNAAANFYPPMQEALALPKGHLTFGAMMVGYAKYTYRRIPLRNEPPVEWR